MKPAPTKKAITARINKGYWLKTKIISRCFVRASKELSINWKRLSPERYEELRLFVDGFEKCIETLTPEENDVLNYHIDNLHHPFESLFMALKTFYRHRQSLSVKIVEYHKTHMSGLLPYKD